MKTLSVVPLGCPHPWAPPVAALQGTGPLHRVCRVYKEALAGG